MKKYILILFVTLTACSVSKPTNNKPVVAVSIVPQQYFVDRIADTLVQVMVLVEPGASPELYEMRPVQMAALAKASAWLGIGKIDFEQGWKDKVLQGNPALQFFDTSVQSTLIAEEIKEHGDHKHMHGVDPHIWSSPKEALNIANETYLALCKILPENQKELEANYLVLRQEIQDLDTQLSEIFANGKSKQFLIFHPSLGYLARDYGLTQIAIEVEGKESSPKYLQQFVDQAKALSLTQILIQKEFNKSIAEQLSQEINGELVEINPLGYDWQQEMLKIAHTIAQN